MKTTIGENIKLMRRKCGFTQEELANMLAVTPQAISKWENGNGTPDISQLIPLSQIFGITTDSLLGVVSATYGEAHTAAAMGHEKILMSTAQPTAEKHLAAYTYFRSESEKEPTNYTLMLKCISHGAEISRYDDFENFLSDKPEQLNEIYADCERKNLCISRYCEDKIIVEKSDYCMTWIYLHLKEFENAKRLIDRLPSLDSNNLKETIMTQYIFFQYGFEKERECIVENIEKLLNVTAKEFFFSLEDHAYFADGKESISFAEKTLHVLDAYKSFDELLIPVLTHENRLRRYMPMCYTRINDFDGAAAQLIIIAENYVQIAKSDKKYKDSEEAKADANAAISLALNLVDENLRDQVCSSPNYAKALQLIENIHA